MATPKKDAPGFITSDELVDIRMIFDTLRDLPLSDVAVDTLSVVDSNEEDLGVIMIQPGSGDRSWVFVPRGWTGL